MPTAIEFDEVSELDIEEQLEELAKLKSVEPTYVPEQLEKSLYDGLDSQEKLYETYLNDKLEDWEAEEAKKLEPLSRGVMLATGTPGAGKGLFGVVLSWKLRRYFQKRRVLMDFRPNMVYDMFAPKDNTYFLFNAAFMQEQMEATAKASGTEISNERTDGAVKGKKLKELKETTGSVAQQWIDKNQVLLVGSITLLDEMKRYFHNRRPHNPYGILLGHVITQWRHFDMLLLGMTPSIGEIDIKSFQTYMTHRVKCSWNAPRERTECKVFKLRYVGNKGVSELVGKPFTMIIDGKKRREELGGYRYYDLWNSKNIHSLSPGSGGIKF